MPCAVRSPANVDVPVLVPVKIPARLSAPADVNVDVAVPPKYAVSKTERRVVDALIRVVRPSTFNAPVSVMLVAESAPPEKLPPPPQLIHAVPISTAPPTKRLFSNVEVPVPPT